MSTPLWNQLPDDGGNSMDCSNQPTTLDELFSALDLNSKEETGEAFQPEPLGFPAEEIVDQIRSPSIVRLQNNDDANFLHRLNDLFANIVESVKPAVVHITPDRSPLSPFSSQQDDSGGSGSGFLICSYGHLLTCAHVVGNQTSIQVTLHDGRKLRGDVVLIDYAKYDLALVKVHSEVHSEIPFPFLQGISTEPRDGETVLAFGSPFLYKGTVTRGIISNSRRSLAEFGVESDFYFIQTDAAINVGNSGGPLVDVDGNMVGINQAKLNESEGMGFALSSEKINEFLTGSDKGSEPMDTD